MPETSAGELSETLARSVLAQRAWARLDPPSRATAIRAVATALDAAASELVGLADRETGLGVSRLAGELGRATFQLRVFADAAEAVGRRGIVIDREDLSPPPVGHPDLRRVLVPLGPVAVFAASNFPFAFGVAGGDTASALAAGCAVVVKAHPSHPQTSRALASLAREALSGSGAPAGLLDVVQGMEAGQELVTHPSIRAAAFTGSQSGGRALFDRAAARPDPIPFFGELGSVNPVVVTPAADSRGKELAQAYVESLTLSAGQFCTKPGLLLLPRRGDLVEHVVGAVMAREAGVLLNSSIATRCAQTSAMLAAVPGVQVVSGPRGDQRVGFRHPTTVLRTTATIALGHLELVHTECFGPVGVVVEYDDEEQLLEVVDNLPGSLVAAIHGDEDEPLARVLVDRLSGLAGRIVWNGWTTGVAVTEAQQHGGPYPASTNSLHTSVGVTAMSRFMRPVAFQSMPAALLPRDLVG